jgi:alpha-L-fucosidase
MIRRFRLFFIFSISLLLPAQSVEPIPWSRNKADRLEAFRDLGFGMFIHWSLDSQLGLEISHSLVGASDDYLTRYIEDLPKTFNPYKFNPTDWARLAKLAGMKYMVFTSKHHNGFAMFNTQTTPFNIMKTPYGRDITGELISAFRSAGISPGFYFSPDDFWWLRQNKIRLQRHVPSVSPANNPGLLRHDQAQVRELMTQYGDIDVMFFDGPWDGLRELAWDINPNTVVTRGGIATPEQFVPGVALDGAWESCITMGNSWPYKPTNENYKSGRELISLLIETRAKGGNLLLNVGPSPEGEIPLEQKQRLEEIALWMFVNGESIYGVRPWVVTNEKDYWFTRKKNTNTVYVMVKEKERWKYGEWKEIALKSIKATPNTKISVLGQNDEALEYQPNVVPKSSFRQQGDTLILRAMHAQRLYTNRQWPNPVVIKLENVEAALEPPKVETTTNFAANLISLGGAASVEAFFEYQDVTGFDLTERPNNWQALPSQTLTRPGAFSVKAPTLVPGHQYEFRPVVRHPLLQLYGPTKSFRAP